jgi:hypothetical protein
MTDLYIDLHLNPITKLGFLAKFKTKVSKGDVSALIDSIQDSKMIKTIKYIYNIQGDLLAYDLVIIKDNANKVLNKHYDYKIKGQPTYLKEDQVIELKTAVENLQNLITKYFPQPNDRD